MDQLRALRVFTRVIDEGSLAAAARALDLAPAVVTRVLAELETHLGARLLNRSSRRLALTDAGAAYLARARRILADVDDADAAAGASTGQARGSLRILCPPAFAVHQLAPRLPAFRAHHPQVTLELAAPGPVETADEHFDVSIVSLGQGSSLTLYATLPSRRHLPARTRVFVDFLVESFGGEARDPWRRDEAGPDQRL